MIWHAVWLDQLGVPVSFRGRVEWQSQLLPWLMICGDVVFVYLGSGLTSSSPSGYDSVTLGECSVVGEFVIAMECPSRPLGLETVLSRIDDRSCLLFHCCEFQSRSDSGLEAVYWLCQRSWTQHEEFGWSATSLTILPVNTAPVPYVEPESSWPVLRFCVLGELGLLGGACQCVSYTLTHCSRSHCLCDSAMADPISRSQR